MLEPDKPLRRETYAHADARSVAVPTLRHFGGSVSKRNPDRDPHDRYFTAAALAQRIVSWAHIEPGMSVLEPSAGEGAFVRPCLALEAEVVAVELLDEQVAKLKAIHGKGTLVVHQADFLQWRVEPTAKFDVAIINPPFSDGADGKHVGHALRQAKRVVALVRTNFEHTLGRWLSCMQYARITRKAVLVDRPPAFGGPGDRNESPMSDYCVLELQRRVKERELGEADLVAVEYWRR